MHLPQDFGNHLCWSTREQCFVLYNLDVPVYLNINLFIWSSLIYMKVVGVFEGDGCGGIGDPHAWYEHACVKRRGERLNTRLNCLIAFVMSFHQLNYLLSHSFNVRFMGIYLASIKYVKVRILPLTSSIIKVKAWKYAKHNVVVNLLPNDEINYNDNHQIC